jgi:hypothetical protein
MKRILAVLAASVSLSLLGCGPAPEAEAPVEAAPTEESGEVQAQACTYASCEELDLTHCGPLYTYTRCCSGEIVNSCYCTRAGWACP